MATYWKKMEPRHDEGGVALVEFALVFPLVMALLLGMFTGGAAYVTKIGMTDAVREGARYGATLDGAVADENAWKVKVVDRIVALAAGDLNTNQICVDFVPSGGTSTCPDGAPAVTSSEDNVHVTAGCRTACPSGVVKKTRNLETVFFSKDLSLTASSFARYERT